MLWRDRRAMAAIEFSMVALVLMVWIFGMMQIARAFWTYQVMQEVAIEGARCMGIVATGCASGGSYNATNTTNYVIGRATVRGLTITGTNITLGRPTSCAGVSGFSSVTITYAFKAAVPLLTPSLTSLTLTAQSCYFNVA